MKLHTKTSGSLLNTEIIKQTHKIMMEHRDGKDVLAWKHRKWPVFANYPTFAAVDQIERHMGGTIFRFYETKKDNPIIAATNLFGKIINIHPFEDENGRIR